MRTGTRSRSRSHTHRHGRLTVRHASHARVTRLNTLSRTNGEQQSASDPTAGPHTPLLTIRLLLAARSAPSLKFPFSPCSDELLQVPVAHLGDALFPILVFELFDGPTLQAHYANPRYAEGVRSTPKTKRGCAGVHHQFLCCAIRRCSYFSLVSSLFFIILFSLILTNFFRWPCSCLRSPRRSTRSSSSTAI